MSGAWLTRRRLELVWAALLATATIATFTQWLDARALDRPRLAAFWRDAALVTPSG